MTDWADEIAARLCNMDRDNREESHQVYLEIATALRAAELRGRVKGMREAADMLEACGQCDCVDHVEEIRLAAKILSPTT